MMKKSKSFTGSRKSSQNPTMNKNAMFGLIRKAKAANEATYKFKGAENGQHARVRKADS